MVDKLFCMEHGADASGQHFLAAFVVFVGNLPGTLHLRGEHRGEGYHVAWVVEVQILYILVHEVNVHIFGQRGGKGHGAVGRQVECGLPRQLLPPRVDEFHFYCFHIVSLILFTMTLCPAIASAVSMAVSEVPTMPWKLTSWPVR